MFSWAETVAPGHVEAVTAALDVLRGDIPEILRYEHGADLGINPGNYDYVVVADFASSEDYLVYRDHPQHQAFIQRHIVGSVADRAAVQYLVRDS